MIRLLSVAKGVQPGIRETKESCCKGLRFLGMDDGLTLYGAGDWPVADFLSFAIAPPDVPCLAR